MVEIRGRLLIGGMVLRNLEGCLDDEKFDLESEWGGYLLVDPPQHECLETGRTYRLELDDGRAGQIEVSRLECVAGQRRLRVQISGRSPLKWPAWARDSHHGSSGVELSALAVGEA